MITILWYFCLSPWWQGELYRGEKSWRYGEWGGRSHGRAHGHGGSWTFPLHIWTLLPGILAAADIVGSGSSSSPPCPLCQDDHQVSLLQPFNLSMCNSFRECIVYSVYQHFRPFPEILCLPQEKTFLVSKSGTEVYYPCVVCIHCWRWFPNTFHLQVCDFPSLSSAASINLSVIVPAYNEEERLPKVCTQCRTYQVSHNANNLSLKKFQWCF